MLHFLDTNVLLYSISRNPDETFKRERAISLLGDDSGALQGCTNDGGEHGRTSQSESVSVS